MQYIGKRLSSYGRLGILSIGIGILMALDIMADISFIYKLWPVLTVILGIGFIGIYVHRSRQEAAFIGIGSYLIGFSALAFYCNLTAWSELSLLWPVFIALFGVSFILMFFFSRQRPVLLLLSGLLFISLALVFFFVFGITTRLWWSVFVFAGISFLIFDTMRN